VQKPILLVDEDESRRRAIASALAARGVRYLDVGDAFAGMAALGRADFGCVIGMEGRRTLSLRGLCLLARKRHPDIIIFVTPKAGSDEATIRQVLELPFFILEGNANAERFATELLIRLDAVDEPTEVGRRPAVRPVRSEETTGDDLFGEGAEIAAFNPFEMPSTEEVPNAFDTVPRVELPHIGQQPALKNPAALPAMPPLQLTPSSMPLKSAASVPTPAGPPVADAFVSEPPEPTRPDARVRSATSTISSQGPFIPVPLVVDGHFEDLEGGAGAAFMMSLFSQELTGRLVVDEGEACGTLYLYRGEPVWADDPHGDAGLYRRLVQRGLLQPDQAIEAVPEGALLGALMQAGLLTSTQLHDFMRDIVRDGVIAIAQQKTGTYHFTEDRAFLETAPLFRVNPFGLVLDARRRSLPPPALMALQSEIEDRYPIPGPGIAAADEKLTPFLRGAKASVVFNGQRTVKDTLSSVGLDPFMGTLVVVTLRDARLVALEDAPRQAAMDLAERAFTDEVSIEFAIAEDEPPPVSPAEAQAREDIYSLYMRLKPLSQPRQILGVGVDADEAAVDAAYRQRLAELDPKRIPEGSAQHILGKRVEELHRKVTGAWQALKLQLGTGSSDNPF
jgi:hypothetical protein